MATKQKFQIFRDAHAALLEETEVQPISSPLSQDQVDGFQRMMAAGYAEGQEVRVLVNTPGLSLLHIWSKKGYPLPRHTHNVDCLYYIISGSVTLGSESLGPRDSFFVPADMPYTYQVGPEGAEVLEIRQAEIWDLKLLAKNPAFFDKAVQAITSNFEAWRHAKRPSLNA